MVLQKISCFLRKFLIILKKIKILKKSKNFRYPPKIKKNKILKKSKNLRFHPKIKKIKNLYFKIKILKF